MLKRITLFLFMVFNLNIYSQVVIKDEIVLDEKINNKEETERTGVVVPMPFYGKVYSQIPCQWNHWTTGWIRKHRFANDQVWDTGCWTANCPGSCFCSWPSTDAWWFYDVPASSNFGISIQRCYVGVLLDVPLSCEFVGNFTYNLYGIDLADGSKDLIGYFKFYSTTPPGCDNAPPCESSPEPPNIELAIKPNLFGDVDVCSEPGTAAGFQPVGGPYFDPNSIIIDVCYNLQTQAWQYEFTNNHTAIFHVVVDYCPYNISVWGGTLINDYQDFPSNYSCQNIVRDLLNHLHYPVRVKRTGSYVLKSILEAHELEHAKYFKNILEKLKTEYHDDMYRELKNCDEMPTVQAAIKYFTEINSVYLTRYWDKARDINEIETGLSGISGPQWLQEKLLDIHEQRNHLKIYKFIFQKIIAARIFHGCIL